VIVRSGASVTAQSSYVRGKRTSHASGVLFAALDIIAIVSVVAVAVLAAHVPFRARRVGACNRGGSVPSGTGWTYPSLAEEGITKQEGEVGMVEVGDRVELASAKVERRPRSGVVTAVRGLMITVRWDTGQQSTVVPASGTLSVLGRKAKSTGQTANKATKKAAGAAKKAVGKTASATDKAASQVAKAVEGRSAKAAKAVERGGARASKALKKSAGRATKAIEASASKGEKAVDKAASKAAGRTRKSRKRAR
jgi:hypothetical protein